MQEPEQDQVSLRLFVDLDGHPRADITGPLSDPRLPGKVDRCLVSKRAAMMTAIRIANANDAEIVVLGEVQFWDDRWGDMVREEIG